MCQSRSNTRSVFKYSSMETFIVVSDKYYMAGVWMLKPTRFRGTNTSVRILREIWTQAKTPEGIQAFKCIQRSTKENENVDKELKFKQCTNKLPEFKPSKSEDTNVITQTIEKRHTNLTQIPQIPYTQLKRNQVPIRQPRFIQRFTAPQILSSHIIHNELSFRKLLKQYYILQTYVRFGQKRHCKTKICYTNATSNSCKPNNIKGENVGNQYPIRYKC